MKKTISLSSPFEQRRLFVGLTPDSIIQLSKALDLHNISPMDVKGFCLHPKGYPKSVIALLINRENRYPLHQNRSRQPFEFFLYDINGILPVQRESAHKSEINFRSFSSALKCGFLRQTDYPHLIKEHRDNHGLSFSYGYYLSVPDRDSDKLRDSESWR